MQEPQISTDKEKLDVDFIHHYLSETAYWSKGRSMEAVKKSIENSMCFGVYSDDTQIGFARVVTDHAVFAWILDVFIIDEYQHKGIGKKLMTFIMEHPDLQNLRRWGLNTWDAHELYKKYGFEKLENPDIYMELVNKPS